jgi:hypothetical protein
MDEDVEMGDAETAKKRPAKRRADVKLGHEFKAKVRMHATASRNEESNRISRKLVVTSRKAASIRMLTCRSRMQRRRVAGSESESGLLVNDIQNVTTCASCFFFSAFLS